MLSKPNPTDWRINLIPIKSYPHSDIPINILQHLRRRRHRVQLGELVPSLISGSTTGVISGRGLCKMIYITCFVYDFDGLHWLLTNWLPGMDWPRHEQHFPSVSLWQYYMALRVFAARGGG